MREQCQYMKASPCFKRCNLFLNSGFLGNCIPYFFQLSEKGNVANIPVLCNDFESRQGLNFAFFHSIPSCTDYKYTQKTKSSWREIRELEECMMQAFYPVFEYDQQVKAFLPLDILVLLLGYVGYVLLFEAY